MTNMSNIPPRFENGLRERIKSKFSFDNYKLYLLQSDYSKENDIAITFSYQRIQKTDFSYMDMSQFDESMIDYYVQKQSAQICLLSLNAKGEITTTNTHLPTARDTYAKLSFTLF